MTTTRRSKSQRQAWWASLTPEEQSAYIERTQQRKAGQPNAAAREATARLEIAQARGIFMYEVPDEDVAARLKEGSRP